MGGTRAAVLSFLVMLLCGLWHGFTWMFIGWGIWHGSMLLVEGLTHSRPMPPALRHGPGYWARILWTNGRVAAGALFFLPDSTGASRVLSGLLRWW
jgi:alginate O-acetyltransferase complex protein AlgI